MAAAVVEAVPENKKKFATNMDALAAAAAAAAAAVAKRDQEVTISMGSGGGGDSLREMV